MNNIKGNFIKIGFSTFALLGAGLILSGCSLTESISQKLGENIVEKTIESQTGGKIDINSDSGQMNIQTEEGTMSVSTGGSGKLPANFPSDMFTYSDAKIIFSLEGAKGTNEYTVNYQTATSVVDAISKYKQVMTGSGWTKESEINTGTDDSTMLTFKKGEKSVAIAIGKSAEDESLGKTSISITGSDASSGAGDSALPIQE